MKKVIIIAAIAIIVLLGTVILVPVLFRDTLLEKTKSTINRNLRANVGFGDFRLSLIKSFPRASLSLGDVVITGKDAFAGDTLLYIKSLSTRFGLLDLLTPDNLTLNELILNDARLKLLVNEKEMANWDILPLEKENAVQPAYAKVETFGMELSKIEINNATVTYTDVALPLDMTIGEINLALKGNMYGNNTRLKAEGTANPFNLTYDSVTYISQKKLKLKSALDIDFEQWNFKFEKSELLVNELPLEVGGTFSMPGDSISFDLQFASAVSGLAEFLTLVPPSFEHYLKDLKASGEAGLKGSFKGVYYEETYPALDMSFKVTGGNIRYAGLPEEIKNIRGDLTITKPQGGFDLTRIGINSAHAEIRNNPVDFSLNLQNLTEDMRFDGKLKGKVNFDHLKDAIPMDSVLVSGLLDIDLGMAGNMSAIENKRYELLKTDGVVALNNFMYESNQLTMPVNVSSGKMDFAPDRINLQQMDMKIGQSDFALSGAVTDYYPYLFTDGTLSGNIRLTSGFLNLNELMGLSKSSVSGPVAKTGKSGKTSKDTLKVAPSSFEVPEKLNLSLQTDVTKALYDKLNITNIRGEVLVSNGRLDLNGVNMNILDGELKLNGTYQNTPQKAPLVNMIIDLVSFDIPTAFRSLKLVRSYLPVAAQSKGKFSTSLKLNGQLDQNMGLIMESLNGTGLFNTMNVQVVNSPVFNKIKTVLNEDKLRDLKIDDFAASFTIANGNLLLKPFTTRISGQEATFSGKLNANNLIDMNIAFIINRDALSENIENTLGVLPGQKNIQSIPVGVHISGPVGDPEVKIDLTDAKKIVRKEVGNATKEEIRNSVNKIGEGLKKLFK